jgi:hypothetical protein
VQHRSTGDTSQYSLALHTFVETHIVVVKEVVPVGILSKLRIVSGWPEFDGCTLNIDQELIPSHQNHRQLITPTALPASNHTRPE